MATLTAALLAVLLGVVLEGLLVGWAQERVLARWMPKMLPSAKVVEQWRIRKADLDDYLKGSMRGSKYDD